MFEFIFNNITRKTFIPALILASAAGIASAQKADTPPPSRPALEQQMGKTITVDNVELNAEEIEEHLRAAELAMKDAKLTMKSFKFDKGKPFRFDTEAWSRMEAALADAHVDFNFDFHFGKEDWLLAQVPPVPPVAPVHPSPSPNPYMPTHPDELARKWAGGFDFHFGKEDWLLAQAPPVPPVAPVHPSPSPNPYMPSHPNEIARKLAGRSEESLYREGTRALDRREWGNAVELFDGAASRKWARSDGALHWKAYALHKLGRRDEALTTINELKKSYPGSRWLDDAKSLEVEVRQASGRPVSPEQQSDEDLKLMAINALMGSDPDRALPLLEKIVAQSSSPKLRERALFVLAQSGNPQAHTIVANAARGKTNPDLQLKAVEYLATRGKESLPVLNEIYGSTNDTNIKRRVLQGYMVSKDRDRLLAVAKSDSSPELRAEAVQWLGNMKADVDLSQLYAGEADPEVRERIQQALFTTGANDRLVEVARSEKEVKLRRSAVNYLSNARRDTTSNIGEALVSLYGAEQDRQVKQSIMHSLHRRNEPARLVELARKESDPGLKREAIRILSEMKSKEATDFLVELLNK